MYKVEYFATETDRLNQERTTKEFDDFERARLFWLSVSNNKMGETRLVHPEKLYL